MENMAILDVINIESTDTTPKVVFNIEKGVFHISGVSMPNDPIKFYEPILAWMDNYKNNPIIGAQFKLELEYFNTASSKIILNIMKMIKDIGNDNKIIWIYDSSDEDIKEVGEDYRDMIGSDVLEVRPN